MTRASRTPDSVTLHVPFRVIKRGGRKEMVLPPGASHERPRVDSTLVKALVRAFRWKRMLESGEFATITELAAREGIAPPYLTRVLRLSLLAPDIVELILDGRQPREMTVEALRERIGVDWDEQRTVYLEVREL